MENFEFCSFGFLKKKMNGPGYVLSVIAMVMHCTLAVPPGSITDPMIVGPEALGNNNKGVGGLGLSFGSPSSIMGRAGSFLNPAELEAYG